MKRKCMYAIVIFQAIIVLLNSYSNMISIFLIAGLLQTSLALQDCAEPISTSYDFEVLQTWPGGANGQVTFYNVRELGNKWSILLKLRGPFLASGRAVISGMLTDNLVNENGTEVLFKSIAPKTNSLDRFNFFVSLSGFTEDDINDILEIAFLFDVQESICFDNDYTLAPSTDFVEEGSAGVGEDLHEYENCTYIPDSLIMNEHLWYNQDFYNVQGNIHINAESLDWVIKIIFNVPVDHLQIWAAIPTREADAEGHVWYLSPAPTNGGTLDQRINFIAAIDDNAVPMVLPYLCYRVGGVATEEGFTGEIEQAAVKPQQTLSEMFAVMQGVGKKRPSTYEESFRNLVNTLRQGV